MKRLMLTAALYVNALGLGLFIALGATSDGSVAQPIAFDHSLHVTADQGPQLECSFCHEHADKSPHATIPNTSLCMGCHQSIRTEAPEIQKLASYAERGEQPPWKRVYWIDPSADVFFSHKPHIRAHVDCAVCHGNVAGSRVVRREVEFTMGRCVDCHRQNQASTDCYICHR